MHNGLSLHFSLVGSGDVTQAFRSLGGCEHRISLCPCLRDRAGDMCAQVWVLLHSLRRGILNNLRVLGIDAHVTTTCVKALLVSASVYVYGAELLRAGFVVLAASHFMLVQV